ncbi:Uncharacterized protein Rs2_21288 [Raphanus sativus]|nr:Uncharacterized protein Rs2_21288 [Raphanus sativus]
MERGQPIYEHDIEYNRLKQLKKLKRMVVIGILVSDAVILFTSCFRFVDSHRSITFFKSRQWLAAVAPALTDVLDPPQRRKRKPSAAECTKAPQPSDAERRKKWQGFVWFLLIINVVIEIMISLRFIYGGGFSA